MEAGTLTIHAFLRKMTFSTFYGFDQFMVTVKASVTLMTQFHFCYTWIVDCHANTAQNDVDQIVMEKQWFDDADDVDDTDVDAEDADAKDADANDADADANADAEQWARAEGPVARIPVIGGIT